MFGRSKFDARQRCGLGIGVGIGVGVGVGIGGVTGILARDANGEAGNAPAETIRAEPNLSRSSIKGYKSNLPPAWQK